jgi:zeaxanthin glucosyltransferase
MRSSTLSLQFAFFCPPYPGHLNPMIALGSALRAGGHRVCFVGLADIAASARAAGLDCAPVGLRTHPPGTLPALEARLARLRGLLGIRAVIADVAAMTDMLCREAPAALQRLEPDGIVFDQLEPAGGLLARHLGLRCVSVANALMLDREPYVPPPFTDWSYARTRWARERNLGGYRVSDWMMARVAAVISHWAAAVGLAPCRRAEQCVAPRQIGQMSPLLDFPREELSDAFHYAGPLRRPLSDEPPWQPPTAAWRPLAFVSLGSLQGGRHALIAAICQACDELGLTAVVAHNGRLGDAQVAALPGSPIVEKFLPQRRVIEHCAIVVSHGGMNTVLDALSAGVPLALVPLAMEQGAIAERVVRAGAGERLRGPLHGAAALRRLIANVLARPAYRVQAHHLARSLHAGGGVDAAAERIERHVQA